MFTEKLVNYESNAARRWTRTWCAQYAQALQFVINKVDSVIADAKLAGTKPASALVAESVELSRKQAVVIEYIRTHYSR